MHITKDIPTRYLTNHPVLIARYSLDNLISRSTIGGIFLQNLGDRALPETWKTVNNPVAS